jgi:hypothetical protein
VKRAVDVFAKERVFRDGGRHGEKVHMSDVETSTVFFALCFFLSANLEENPDFTSPT